MSGLLDRFVLLPLHLKHETTEESEETDLAFREPDEGFEALRTPPNLLGAVLGAERPLLGFLLAPLQLLDLLIDLLSDPCGLVSGFLHARIGFGAGILGVSASRFKLGGHRVDLLLGSSNSPLALLDGRNLNGLTHGVGVVLE